MALVFFGTPHFAVPSLRALLDSGETVCAVVCQPDKPQGRGRKVLAPPVKEFASERSIPVLQPTGIRDAAFIGQISGFEPEAIVVVAYGKILPPPLLAVPRLGCVNVHASLLPRYRGAAPIQWAVIRCEKKTGITTMMMDEGLDTGDILLQEESDIDR